MKFHLHNASHSTGIEAYEVGNNFSLVQWCKFVVADLVSGTIRIGIPLYDLKLAPTPISHPAEILHKTPQPRYVPRTNTCISTVFVRTYRYPSDTPTPLDIVFHAIPIGRGGAMLRHSFYRRSLARRAKVCPAGPRAGVSPYSLERGWVGPRRSPWP
jgi:hypothetical protein